MNIVVNIFAKTYSTMLFLFKIE